MRSPMQPIKLKRMHDLWIPDRLFGSTLERARKVINTFHLREHSTGVLLAGKKGTGKTMLARVIARLLQEDSGIPTVIVPFNLIGPEVADFIDKIDTECMVLFDEIDKIPGDDDVEVSNNTNCLLSLFDGLSSHKRLYVLTANDVDKINKQFLNRPGRIYYKLNFGSLENATIVDYCTEHLNNKEYVKDMQHISTLIRDFSFDIMQAVVEECNRYDLSPREACDMLNVSPELSGEFQIRVFNKSTGEEYELPQFGNYRYLDFGSVNNSTEILFYDYEKGRSQLKKNSDVDRFDTDEEFRKRQSQCTRHLQDTKFKNIEDGALIYEVEDVIVKCTPVRDFYNRDRFLAF